MNTLSDDSYPSGNLAVIVVREKNQLACIVQEDKPHHAETQAVFMSGGRSTCYYPSGAVWYVQAVRAASLSTAHFKFQRSQRVFLIAFRN